MDFISQRQSHASSFVSRTEREQSYLLSSRVSRKRLIYDQSAVSNDGQAEMDDFKQQIHQRYLLSVSNKIYTFPFTEDIYDDDQQGQQAELQKVLQYNLFDQKEQRQINLMQKKPIKKFKTLTKNSQSKTINELLESLRTQKQRLQNLKSYVKENFEMNSKRISNINANTKNSSSLGLKKDNKRYGNSNINSTNLLKQTHLRTSYENSIPSHANYYEAIEQEPLKSGQKPIGYSHQRKRLKTEPYQKPTGFIMKKQAKAKLI